MRANRESLPETNRFREANDYETNFKTVSVTVARNEMILNTRFILSPFVMEIPLRLVTQAPLPSLNNPLWSAANPGKHGIYPPVWPNSNLPMGHVSPPFEETCRRVFWGQIKQLFLIRRSG